MQLSKKYNISTKTIQRYLSELKITKPIILPSNIVLLMDTTYFGRSFGVMLFKDALTGRNLLKYYVKNETNKLYAQGIDELLNMGFDIQAIVCDGRKGLLNLYTNIPTQMCQFHQVAITRRYLTQNPKTEAGKELKAIVQWLKQTDKESFTGLLNGWEIRWELFLKERTINPLNQKTQYTHRRLRSAIRSLKNNLPYLFTWYDYMHLKIPNTTNAIDGHFANLKQKLRNHNGLSMRMKKQFIDEFLKA